MAGWANTSSTATPSKVLEPNMQKKENEILKPIFDPRN